MDLISHKSMIGTKIILMIMIVVQYIDKSSYNFSASSEASQIKDGRSVTLRMNHRYVTLGIAAIIAAVAVSAVGFAIPQQALAHYSHHHHNHNNGIKVNQDISQANVCNNQTTCVNSANNNVDIDR